MIKTNGDYLKSNSKWLKVSAHKVLTVIAYELTFLLLVKGKNSIVVNWGDGLIETFQLSETFISVTHTWAGSFAGREITFTIENIENITGVESSGAVGTNFSFDIAKLENLDYLNLVGTTNRVWGDLTNLTKLTILRMSGFNSISGTAVNLNNLTFFSATGRNRLYGNVTGKDFNCTISLSGNQKVSGIIKTLALRGLNYVVGFVPNYLIPVNIFGSFSNITGWELNAPAYMRVESSLPITIAFSSFNYENLCYLKIGNTILSNANQLEILQGVWDNRDVLKERSESTIDLRGHASTPVADSATLALKALLEAYISPGIAGKTRVNWIILTR